MNNIITYFYAAMDPPVCTKASANVSSASVECSVQPFSKNACVLSKMTLTCDDENISIANVEENNRENIKVTINDLKPGTTRQCTAFLTNEIKDSDESDSMAILTCK